MAAAIQVLVVEDDGELREELCDLLTFEGYQPISCRDGRSAWAQLSSGLRPGVIVTDLGLPGLSGRELVMLVRQQAWGRQMPVLLLSAWEGASRFDIAADMVLAKSVDPETFARAVDRLSQRDAQLRDVAGAARRPPKQAAAAEEAALMNEAKLRRHR
ncbi:MAG TPA: response regulator [Polyangia bacterium]|nr:response regulator [Polyangia bacterium]